MSDWIKRFSTRIRSALNTEAVRRALVTFAVSRTFYSVWAIVVLAFLQLPTSRDDVIRPYLGERRFEEGWQEQLLGPWQRFDTQHYMRIARQGYESPEDSVFPPLYPLLIRGVGVLIPFVDGMSQRHMIAGILISNAAFLCALVLLYRLVEHELDAETARRTLRYLALFPTSFYLLAAYTESMFLLLVLVSMTAARSGKFWQGGLAGLAAALTRTAGGLLVVPIGYMLWRHWHTLGRRKAFALLGFLLPAAGALVFLIYRNSLNLPGITEVYRTYWYQTTTVPGRDVVTAIGHIMQGTAPFRLYFDLFCTLLLIASTVLAFKRLGTMYGLYSLVMLLFILLPASDLKPLFSFSRYTLVFFPTFMVLGMIANSPSRNRLVVYPSFALSLYFSGQFFIWGWVA